jgi:hypothetical protein
VLPQIGGGQAPSEQELFQLDYRFGLNMVFLAMSAMMSGYGVAAATGIIAVMPTAVRPL